MKSFLTIAVLAMATAVLAVSDFSKGKMNEIHLRNARYGRPDMSKLSRPKIGRRGKHILGDNPGDNPAGGPNYVKIGGYQFDVSNPKVTLIGLALGTQEDTSVTGSCFVMTVELIAFLEEF